MTWTLLHKYLSGECISVEIQEVNDWRQADKKNRQFMASLQKVWKVEPADEVEVDAKAAWDLFCHKLSADRNARTPKSVHERDRQKIHTVFSVLCPAKRYARTIAVGLSAAAVILIAALFYNFVFQNVSDGSNSLATQAKMQQINTKRAQQATFKLSDGTMVQLNADSKIEIARNFGDSTRSVYLQGEAYFHVAHNPETPFIVHTGAAYTKVLGTKFDVKSYPDDQQRQVIVEEGKVALGSSTAYDKKSKVLTKNQIGSFSGNGKLTVSGIADIQQYLGWKDGRLVFNSTPFREVKPRLERWYNIKIVVDDTSALNPQKLTASFEDEPITEVMNAIALSMDLYYKRERHIITFYSN